MNMLALVAPVLGIVALLFAYSLSQKVSKQDAGTDRMKEIAAFIHEGAQAFLMAEYKILVVFVAVLFVCVGLGIGWVTAAAFLLGAVFSTIAGYCGMKESKLKSLLYRTRQQLKEYLLKEGFHV